MQKALVTGASGYIGSHVCAALLEAGWAVDALVRPESKTGRFDRRVTPHVLGAKPLTETLQDVKADVVFHLAANVTSADKNAGLVAQDNIVFGAEVLEAMLPSGCRKFVNVETYWEFDEKGNPSPNTLYAACKLAFKSLLDWYARRYAFSTASLVLFDVYGPNDWRDKLLPTLIKNLGAETPMDMTSGAQLLDLVHVRDVVAAVVKAAARLHPATSARWSVATGRRVTLKEMVFLLEKASGKKLPLRWGAKDYPSHQIMRPLGAMIFPAVPGWKPSFSLEDGFKDILKE